VHWVLINDFCVVGQLFGWDRVALSALGKSRKVVSGVKAGIRIAGPAVNKPAEVSDFIIDVYPDMQKLVALAQTQNITEPMYLRRPDAVPTAERA